MGKIRLIPGKSVTGDANDRHDPKEILNVKSFYEQDSHVMPDTLKEIHATVTEGIENVWYEYAPADLCKEEKPALVISLHGGGQDGYGQCYATSWTMLADQYHFVCVFPTASRGRAWDVDAAGPDFTLIQEVIRQAKERYGVDEERIFLQGMSMGNMMTAALCKHSGAQFAGAGMAAGPDSVEHLTDPSHDFGRITAIPVFMSRGERDSLIPRSCGGILKDRYALNKADREYWLKVNGCESEPSVIKIEGRNNFFVYEGTKARLIYRDVKGRGHGQTVDDAEMVWRYCFSACRRLKDGSLKIEEPLDSIESDRALILADGSKNAFVNSEKRELSGAVYQIREVQEVPEDLQKINPALRPQYYGPYTYAPVDFLADVFGFQMEETNNGHGAILSSEEKGLVVEVAEGNVACLYNGVLSNMERQAEYRDGILYIPVGDFAEKLGLRVTELDGVVYITDHAAEMTSDFARYMREIL